MAKIRDLSIYDSTRPIDFPSYDGFVIRCWNGSYKDGAYETHKGKAKNAGKAWWAYMFFNFLYPALPQIQAVIDILKVEKGAIALAIDVEEWGGHKYPARDVLLGYLQVLYYQYKMAFGEVPQFYMNPATIHYLKPIPPWLLGCLLWIAHWGVSSPDYEPWAEWTFWQYKSVAGEDFNHYNGTDEEYFAFVGGEQPGFPEYVYVDTGELNIRSQPNPSSSAYVIGKTYSGAKWKPLAKVIGTDYKEWWQINDCAFIASWYTRW